MSHAASTSEYSASGSLLLLCTTRIPFVAVAHQQNENVADNHGNSLSFESIFCSKTSEKETEDDVAQRQHRYEHFASYKLKNVDMNARSTMFTSQLGKWFIKGYGGFIYIVCTSLDYPDDLAVECLDELYETHRAMTAAENRRFWNPIHNWGWRRQQQQQQQQQQPEEEETQQSCKCCEVVATLYEAMENEDSVPHVLAQVDSDARNRYSQSIRNLQVEVDRLTKEMDDNLQDLIARGENIERLDALAQDLVDQTLVFKKQAKKVRRAYWMKRTKGLLIGTGVTAAAGAAVGFMAGGPGGAALLTGASSVAAAEAIEAGIGALVFSMGYLGFHAAQKSWFSSLKFVLV